jgi:hypothetical protein
MMKIEERLRTLTQGYIDFIIDSRTELQLPEDWRDVAIRKKDLLCRRDAEVVKCTARVCPSKRLAQTIDYIIHFEYLIKQKDYIYIEEECMERSDILMRDGKVHSVYRIVDEWEEVGRPTTKGKGSGLPYKYNRMEAIKYAEAWWNSRNPRYNNFPDNCTNFISQCLHAGEIPMTGYPRVGNGWWQQNNQWSWSWSVAHSFQLYLTNTPTGPLAEQVKTPEELRLGDIIAYDFENDGRWNHTTIVTGKDAKGMPLVNAHSADSRKRYWSYEDSSKYTPQMKYKFFRILDNVY